MGEAIANTSTPWIAGSRWTKTFFFLTAAMSSTILLKVQQIQYLELLYFVQLAILAYVFAKNQYQVSWFRPYFKIAIYYLIFCLVAIILSFASLRYDFYYPPELNVLKYPVVITMSRVAELLASVFIMLYLATKFRDDETAARFTMRVYFWVGFASGFFSILTFPLNLAGFDLGTYSDSHRMRGFYNEGGPYGLYVLSVFLVGISLYRLDWEKKGKLRFAFAVLSIAFIGSQSKAAFVAILAMFLLNGFLSQSVGRRLAFVSGAVVFLVLISQVVDLAEGIRIYQQAGEAYERASRLHPDDANFVYGRVAGAFLVPRMIEAHPVTGVGWGNYGIVRNAPEYRGASFWAEINDDPGLGLFGTTAELGLPLTLYLMVCLFLPYVYLRRKKAPLFLTNLVLLQPVVHIFGAQLNLTYPWILTSFALGITFAKASKGSSEGRALITVPSN